MNNHFKKTATRTLQALTCSAACSAVVALIFIATPAQAQTDWPKQPIKLIVPFPAGGSVDTLARTLAPSLQATLGQTIIVDNRGGGSGSIGAGIAAKSPADGYTFLLVFDTHAVNPSLIPNMPFDTLKDLTPVMLIGTSPMVLVAHKDVPVKSFTQMMAYNQVKPGTMQFGTISSGSLAHLTMSQLGNIAKQEFTHIPYKGGGPLVNDVVGGQVPYAMGTVFLLNQHIVSGRVKPLAVTSSKRSPSLPNVPTIAENGFPNFEALAWWGALAPAGTPAPILKKFNDALRTALKQPAIADKLASQGMEVVAKDGAAFDGFLRGEVTRWAKVVKLNNIKAGE
jgi:tripartite-type tricarboxylate transporter receptor subunit TctC